MAKTYGILPSQVRATATIYDLEVMDVMMAWEKYKEDKANGTNQVPELSNEEMLKMLQRVKGK